MGFQLASARMGLLELLRRRERRLQLQGVSWGQAMLDAGWFCVCNTPCPWPECSRCRREVRVAFLRLLRARVRFDWQVVAERVVADAVVTVSVPVVRDALGPDLYDPATRTVLAHPAQKLAVQAWKREQER